MAEEIFSSALNDFTRAAPPIITMPGSISAISATLSTRDRSPCSKITTFSLLVSLNFSASFCAPWKSRNGCTTVTLIFPPERYLYSSSSLSTSSWIRLPTESPSGAKKAVMEISPGKPLSRFSDWLESSWNRFSE